jgi:hypothetical protein
MQERPSFSKLWKENKSVRYLVLLMLSTVLFLGVYRVLLHYAELAEDAIYSFFVMVLYMVLLVGFVLAYLIYNRFLYRKNLTPEDLPDTMSAEQKQEFIADGERRLERSKWMMLFIFPLALVLLFDAAELFIFDLFRK